MEPFFTVDTANLRCGHSFCRRCLAGKLPTVRSSVQTLPNISIDGLMSMSQQKMEFKCCGNSIPFEVIQNIGGLGSDFLEKYPAWIKELHAIDPVYCPYSTCWEFIPPLYVQGPSPKCPFCHGRLCLECKNKQHLGICSTDHKLRCLARKEKWKYCPQCHALVERVAGCDHMVCLCGMGFCYQCGMQRGTPKGCRC
jgi:hypothetical protein